MPDHIPWEKAEQFAHENDCKVVVVLAWDGIRSHIVTFGETIEQSDFTADKAHQIKCMIGWDSGMYVESAKVKALKQEVESLKKRLADAESQIPKPDPYIQEMRAQMGWYSSGF